MIKLTSTIQVSEQAARVFGVEEPVQPVTQMERFLAQIMRPMMERVHRDIETVNHAIKSGALVAYEEGVTPRLVGLTGVLVDTAASGPAIICLRCGRVSYNPGDIEHAYCGACHIFHKP